MKKNSVQITICSSKKLDLISSKTSLNITLFEKSVEKIDVAIVSRWCDGGKILYDLMFNARGLKVQKFNDIRLNNFFVSNSAGSYLEYT
jgi:hypothetical protein